MPTFSRRYHSARWVYFLLRLAFFFFYNMATQLRTEARQNVHWYFLRKHYKIKTCRLSDRLWVTHPLTSFSLLVKCFINNLTRCRDASERRWCPENRKLNQNNKHLLLPSTGPITNSLPSTLWFRLTFISYANPVGRKTFVTGFNVQPSSFVSLLLCQTLWRGVLLYFPLCLDTLFGG